MPYLKIHEYQNFINLPSVKVYDYYTTDGLYMDYIFFKDMNNYLYILKNIDEYARSATIKDDTTASFYFGFKLAYWNEEINVDKLMKLYYELIAEDYIPIVILAIHLNDKYTEFKVNAHYLNWFDQYMLEEIFDV